MLAQVSENNPYRHVDNRWGKPQYELDVPKMARDLAKELGLDSAYIEAIDTIRWAEFNYEDFRIYLAVDLGDFVRICIRPRKLTRDALQIEFPKIRVNSARPIDKIAGNVRNLLIAKAQEPLQQYKAFVEERQRQSASLDKLIADLGARFPSLELKKDSSGTSASLFNRGAGLYLNGSIRHDGTLDIQRVGGIPNAQTTAVLSALLG